MIWCSNGGLVEKRSSGVTLSQYHNFPQTFEQYISCVPKICCNCLLCVGGLRGKLDVSIAYLGFCWGCLMCSNDEVKDVPCNDSHLLTARDVVTARNYDKKGLKVYNVACVQYIFIRFHEMVWYWDALITKVLIWRKAACMWNDTGFII